MIFLSCCEDKAMCGPTTTTRLPGVPFVLDEFYKKELGFLFHLMKINSCVGPPPSPGFRVSHVTLAGEPIVRLSQVLYANNSSTFLILSNRCIHMKNLVIKLFWFLAIFYSFLPIWKVVFVLGNENFVFGLPFLKMVHL